jgi:hypothetical protein
VIANFASFARNRVAKSFAFKSYAALSAQVLRGSSTSVGTPRTAVGICNPKIGCVTNFAERSDPSKIAVTNALVYANLNLDPVPYGPPVHPVFNNQTSDLCVAIRSRSISAYRIGGRGMNGPPKHAEKFGIGSVTPASVPASFHVYPFRK